MLDKQTLGQYIRAERENYMSLRAFAKELGVSASYLSDLELDRRRGNKALIMRLACTFKQVAGGSHHRRYDDMLDKAGLMTPERKCLLKLWESNIGVCSHSVFAALYGEINKLDADMVRKAYDESPRKDDSNRRIAQLDGARDGTDA